MERRGSDKITKLHSCLIVGSFVLLAVNIMLSWLTKLVILWYPSMANKEPLEVSWMLYALVAGMLLSANLYKVPSFLKLFDRK